MITAIALFAAAYLCMAGRPLPFLHIDRPAAALIGAVAMVATQVLTIDEAFAAIDLQVLALLLGVMLIASYLAEAKFFRYTAWLVLTRARSARSLLCGLVFIVGGLSALLVNDTVCLMLTPLVVAVVAEAELPPLPYLLALATASNVGGAVTFTGNPQNMLIGHAAAGDPSYARFLMLSLPVGALCLALDAAVIIWLFRRELPRGPLPARETARPFPNWQLAARALAALGVFVALAFAGMSLAGAAMTAAAALILVANTPPRPVFARVDWSLLLFFAGLFVLVGGLARSGALERVFGAAAPLIASGGLAGDAAFAGLTVLASNLVSNVPFVMVAIEWVPTMPDPTWGYVMLAFAATLAGNLTLFGSVANIIVFEGAGPRGEIGFFRFLRYGAVITLVTLAGAFAVLGLERQLGLW
ncbi:MAG TPA: SLC13 family permease [Kofleriaceae bacterium]|nr:SLC13 family permease [Kofleriaceae bacterium]